MGIGWSPNSYWRLDYRPNSWSEYWYRTRWYNQVLKLPNRPKSRAPKVAERHFVDRPEIKFENRYPFKPYPRLYNRSTKLIDPASLGKYRRPTQISRIELLYIWQNLMSILISNKDFLLMFKVLRIHLKKGRWYVHCIWYLQTEVQLLVYQHARKTQVWEKCCHFQL